MHSADWSHGLGAETSISTERKAWGAAGGELPETTGAPVGGLDNAGGMPADDTGRAGQRDATAATQMAASSHPASEHTCLVLSNGGRIQLSCGVPADTGSGQCNMVQKTMRDRLQSELTNKTQQSSAKDAIITKVLRMRSLSDVLGHVAWSRF
jgi:hypothetical protein